MAEIPSTSGVQSTADMASPSPKHTTAEKKVLQYDRKLITSEI